MKTDGTHEVKLLRQVLDITETSGAYYLFSIPMARICDQSVLSLFEPRLTSPPNIDIIHSAGSVLEYFKNFRRLVRTGGYNVTHAHSPHVGLVSIFSLISVLGLGQIGKLFSVHYSYNFIRPRNRLFLLIIFLFFDRIIFCSQSSFNSFPKMFQLLVRNKYRIIKNGIDLNIVSTFKKEKKLLAENQQYNLLSIGRIERIKRFEILIQAMEKLQDKSIRLTIIGDGSELDSIKKQVNDVGLARNINFTGEIERTEVYNHLSQADVFISASVTEGHPVSVIEAMAFGVPLILSDIEPHLEIASECSAIRTFHLDDPDDLSQKILELINLPKEHRRIIGTAEKDLVMANYATDLMTADYFNSYLEIKKS